MNLEKHYKKIAIIGGGPAGLFIFKRLVESFTKNIAIHIFEKNDTPGPGMPYSADGSNTEHIANVSDNELPQLILDVKDWVQKVDAAVLKPYNIDPDDFNEYKVIPRLLLGKYLAHQFDLLLKIAKNKKIPVTVSTNTTVNDLADDEKNKQVQLFCNNGEQYVFDIAIVCTGHRWPKKWEGKIKGWFDSPYPPSKLCFPINHPVAIKGSSLTAIDAVRTLALQNGRFEKMPDGKLSYTVYPGSENFRVVMHSLKGLLPAIRFHLEDPQLSKDKALTDEAVNEIKAANDGFVPLDLIFDQNFKQPLRQRNPVFYEKIKSMTPEAFVEYVMNFREELEPFVLLKAEYAEAEKSIKRQQSIDWKEELSALSYALNYPAKHFSAEDIIRLKNTLMPLIAIIIAMVPQGSARVLMALHNAGILDIVSVDKDSEVIPQEEGGCRYVYTDEHSKAHEKIYKMFVDGTGQKPFRWDEFIFQSLVRNGTVSPARLKFRSATEAEKQLSQNNDQVEQDTAGDYWLQVNGININDRFQVIDQYGAANERIYVMAVPYISGLNPDFSGLDFCERASQNIADGIKDQD